MNGPARGNGRTIVVGAGMGGLASAIALAAAGFSVTVVEKEAYPGGKMRQVHVDGAPVDGGPTVLTMKQVFESVFACAGKRLEDHVGLSKANLLARHHWTEGPGLDLFADTGDSAAAIADFAGPGEADGYLRFCADARRIFEILDTTYIRAQRPGPLALATRIGLANVSQQFALKPFSSMWSALGGYFRDPRLRQLFGRYATYCGSSPFDAPATLMLVAHVEQDGVWLVEGGMHALARALHDVACELGVEFRFSTQAEAIETRNGAVTGIRTDRGERISGQSVVFNGDVSALLALLPERGAFAPVAPGDRSLSALTWCVRAQTTGVPLAHHNVFFSDDYAGEFESLVKRREMHDEPTVYICAQDRDDEGALSASAGQADGERMLCLINAPADGDRKPLRENEVETCLTRTLAHLRRCGLTVDEASMTAIATPPQTFHTLFPGTGGALYGRASHGWTASFQRPGATTPIRGLYLAGGSAHPGPGLPMAAISGMLAAERLVADTGLTRPSPLAAISGGMQTA